MRVFSPSLLVVFMLVAGIEKLGAQTPEIQQKIDRELDLKRLQGTWVPDLLVTAEGAEPYPLAGRALLFDRSDFIRVEGKRAVASGSFNIEDGFLRLSIKDRKPWDLEAAIAKDKVQCAYKIDGDVLTLSYSVGNVGKAGDLTPGENKQVVVYKRQRADANAKPGRARR